MPKPNHYVVDTSTLVSAALLPRSVPRQAVDKALDTGVLLLSVDTLAEADEVLRRPKLDAYVSEEDRLAFLVALLHEAHFVRPTETLSACKDPKDNMFLELAVAGKAKCIISSDSHLLELDPFRNIRIVLPANFLKYSL